MVVFDEEMVQILTWNIRDLISDAKKRSIQDVLCQYCCEMVLIQKTKLEVSSFLVCKIWFLNCLLEKHVNVRTMELEWSCISREIVAGNMMDKLRVMKQFLRVWNKDVFGSVDERIEATSMLHEECNTQVGCGEGLDACNKDGCKF
ncbi:hypothetical protein V6N13_126585 [Hibiscus sabdariffa]|uniref:Uncharacterized protein n=1 Tax=Hibiscus sabdariffa TaxID=183260 RepID=A0ABR2RF19_9ROSI